jgi:hypothetical protein
MDIHTTVLESAQIACIEKFPVDEDKLPIHALIAYRHTSKKTITLHSYDI